MNMDALLFTLRCFEAPLWTNNCGNADKGRADVNAQDNQHFTPLHYATNWKLS